MFHLADLARVESGDVLVAHNIDPGWTSVFPLLAGLVTETGGVLSHGALLAREYGIPAVMGVPGATSRWRDGDRVTVEMSPYDLEKGRLIFRHKDERPASAGPGPQRGPQRGGQFRGRR